MTDPAPTRLFGYLSYRDAPAGIEFLTAIGFATVTRQDGEHGLVQHCELRLGDAVVMVASFDEEYEVPTVHGVSTGRGLYLRTDDVDGFYGRAMAAGASSLFAPEDTAWGTRRARVLDPGGQEWSFGSYEPGSAW